MPPGSLQGMVLSTKDIVEAYRSLTDKGLTLSPVQSAPWGRYATFEDPDGNGWVLEQPTSDF